MDSRIRVALERIANECDIGEHTEIARKALLAAEPEPCDKQSLLFVDATPNDGYVTRILSAYIDDSYYSDNTIGLPPENPLVNQMNEWREQRNALLRAAISKLNASQVADKRAEDLREQVETLSKRIPKLSRWEEILTDQRDSFARICEEMGKQVETLRKDLDDTTGWVESFNCQCDHETDTQCPRCFISWRNRNTLAATEPKPSAKEN